MDIDVVIIGVNSEKTLSGCIESVLQNRYTQGAVRIFYVDGGSTDGSVALAKGYDSVAVIEIHPEFPAPGLGRNAGWRAGSAPLVQFLDSDTLMDPEWLAKAAGALTPEVGAVRGNRDEINPQGSVYNWIGQLEWNAPPGECEAFGGDVLIRRSILEATGGYDEVLVGGEDPELSRRVIRAGWRILRLPAPMTCHDLAMNRIRQYLKRAFRSGYGFAAVRAREARQNSDFWHYEMRKIGIRGGGFVLLSIAGVLLVVSGSGVAAVIGMGCLAVGIILLLRPRLFLVNKFKQRYNLSRKQANCYAWHCSVIVLPQLLGVVRYYWGKWLNRPLRNRRRLRSTSSIDPKGMVS